ncbi:Legume-like lectin family protein [Ancylostoma ceylanicum]|uniref:Legume-like lectin family protein n=1 Tax=Ancylostoma ceylanicum TaxID=53326 RepID=A0A0D6LYP9_9BILA|nr:Legume-like lectin family protein [Ancylostoma ceylanicum]
MWRILLLLGAVKAEPPSASPTAAEVLAQSIDGTSVHEFRGYYKREHSLTRPYQGAGMEIPYWNIQGSSMVSSQQIRLTADEQSRRGAIWNMQQVWSRDWEFQVSFKVTGSTGDLFGDGMAIWYVSEPNQMGPVFGGKDYFRGLGVFLDTYSNHNGPHSVVDVLACNLAFSTAILTSRPWSRTVPYITIMTRMVLTHSWVENIPIFTDISGKYEWKLCLSVNNVQLPTGYYFGISAATGDLSDNHDVIGVKMFEQEFAHVDRAGETDRKDVVPNAAFKAAPRDHIDDPQPSKLGWFGTIVLVIVGIVVLVGALGFGVIFFQKRSERQRKRFY